MKNETQGRFSFLILRYPVTRLNCRRLNEKSPITPSERSGSRVLVPQRADDYL